MSCPCPNGQTPVFGICPPLSYLTSRLIALGKALGVCPIGIGDTAHRILSRAILMVLKPDIMDVIGVSQLCAGQVAGVESAVHSVQRLFKHLEAALLVDASNAFNSLNRSTAMRNLLSLCPLFATPMINCYREPSDLFIDGEAILSQEGITQGDPFSMPFYALALIPLIWRLPTRSVKHVWYADDATAVGSIDQLRQWWNDLNKFGSVLGITPTHQRPGLSRGGSSPEGY